jgi:hypothetical protein
VDGRSDLYAVGVILYQLVVGELPFTASSPVGILSKHLAEAPVRPTLRRPGLSLPPLFERAILRALAKDPDERPQTAEQMRRELRDAATGVSDWHVPTSQLLATGTSSSRDLPAQPTTPIHIAQLASVTERRGSDNRIAAHTRPGVMAGGGSTDVPSTVLAPATMSTRWPRRLGGLALGLLIAGAGATWLWIARPFGLAEMLPGKTVSPTQPAVATLPEVIAPPPVTAPPAAASATTAAPTADDDLPVVAEPHDPTPSPTSVTEPRIIEPDRKTRVTKRGRRAGSPPVAAGAAPGEPPGEAPPRPESAAAAAEPAPIAAPVREHRAPTPATDPMKEAERLLAQGEVANACKKGEEQKTMTPRLPSIYKFLGKCYMRAGQPDRAKEAYRRYLELAPDAADAAFIKSIVK